MASSSTSSSPPSSGTSPASPSQLSSLAFEKPEGTLTPGGVPILAERTNYGEPFSTVDILIAAAFILGMSLLVAAIIVKAIILLETMWRRYDKRG